MHLSDLYRGTGLDISIEIFPPKTPDGDSNLFNSLKTLTRYQPAFISCTYGAGGSTRERTLELCDRIQREFGVTATAHFTCIGSTKDELVEWLDRANKKQIKNVLALRGDPPKGETSFKAVKGGLSYANELVSLIRTNFPTLGIGVAGYPEKHPEATDAETDLVNLKRKIDAGANAVYTQLFYSNDNFFAFRDRYARAGMNVPLVPGIMPITEFARIKRITSMCGAIIPAELGNRLEEAKDDKAAQFEIGVGYAIEQCRQLIANGVPGIHFYALNRSKACETILEALGRQPKQAVAH